MATANDLAQAYLTESRRQLETCGQRIRHCVEQLSDDQLWWRAGGELNSIGNLLLHLEGNMSERILSLIGGLPYERRRDQEFAHRDPIAKDQLLARVQHVFRRADAVLAALAPEQLLETRRYRMLAGEIEGTLVRLVLQTLVHVGGHTQEIASLARLQLGDHFRYQQSPRTP